MRRASLLIRSFITHPVRTRFGAFDHRLHRTSPGKDSDARSEYKSVDRGEQHFISLARHQPAHSAQSERLYATADEQRCTGTPLHTTHCLRRGIPGRIALAGQSRDADCLPRLRRACLIRLAGPRCGGCRSNVKRHRCRSHTYLYYLRCHRPAEYLAGEWRSLFDSPGIYEHFRRPAGTGHHHRVVVRCVH